MTVSKMKNLSRLALVFALCALALPAVAQNAAAPQQPAMNGPVASPPPSGGWGDEAFERQELREEMEQIRKEHEELEVQTDALIDKCVKPGAAADSCEKEKLSLKDRRLKLHDRRQALRDKIEAEHKERAAMFGMPHGMVPLSQPAAAPTAPTGSATPAAQPPAP
jgi:hypothetical protein